jgi:hypothetical protein
MNINDINAELQYLARAYYDELTEIEYNEMLEAMFGSDPRWNGPDWDWNEGLWYWETVK